MWIEPIIENKEEKNNKNVQDSSKNIESSYPWFELNLFNSTQTSDDLVNIKTNYKDVKK